MPAPLEYSGAQPTPPRLPPPVLPGAPASTATGAPGNPTIKSTVDDTATAEGPTVALVMHAMPTRRSGRETGRRIVTTSLPRIRSDAETVTSAACAPDGDGVPEGVKVDVALGEAPVDSVAVG